MWRTTNHLAIATLLATAALVGPADASAIQSYVYNTGGDIAGISGSPTGYPITFNPQNSTAMLTTPGTFTLGTITTSPLPAGATLTYDDTPFTIDLNVGPVTGSSGSYYGYSPPSYNGFTPAYTYIINGVLNGSLKGDGTSTLFPSITSVTGSGSTPPFDAADLMLNLQGIAAPVGGTFGTTTLTAHVDITGTPLPAPAPEPTSVAAFAALIGWAWHRRRAAARGNALAPA